MGISFEVQLSSAILNYTLVKWLLAGLLPNSCPAFPGMIQYSRHDPN